MGEVSKYFILVCMLLGSARAFAFTDEGFHSVQNTRFTPALSLVEKAVVTVVITDRLKTVEWGSAFLVKVYPDGRGLFLTNAHVIQKCGLGQSLECSVQAVHHGWFVTESPPELFKSDPEAWSARAEHIYMRGDFGSDLAAFTIQLPPNASRVPVKFKSWAYSSEPGGNDVAAFGTPDLTHRSDWHVQQNDLEPAQSVWSIGHVIATATMSHTDLSFPDQPYLLHSADTLPGSSGGPVVDRDGNVLAVDTLARYDHLYEYSSNFMAQAIPAQKALAFLNLITP